MAGPEIISAVQLGVAQGQALVNNALQSIRQLRQAYIDVILQPEVLHGFQQQLRDIQAKFEPLSQFRLRSSAAQTAVNRLLNTVASVLKEIEQQQNGQQQAPPPFLLKRLWQAMCVCSTGPSELTRRLQLWQEQVRGAVESVERERDNLQPQLSPRLLESLPQPCVTNHATLKEAVDAIKDAAACSVTQTVTAAGPPVIQLLGMGGMGKSVLALQVALELDKGATFPGGVYFLPVPPKPASEGDTQQAADAATMIVQRELLRKLRFSELAKDPATVREWKQELAVVFARADTSYLLVLDDVWDQRILDGLRCPAMKGVILVTARLSVCSGLSTVWLKPDDGSKQAARDLMTELLASAEYKDQAIVDSILDRCDGHLLAVDIMGKALRQYSTKADWQTVEQQFISRLETDVSDSSQIVFGALHSALDSLSAAHNRESRTAVKAFTMLQHLQARLVLPTPMLQLLWSWVYPNELAVKILLDRLVNASLLYTDSQGKGFRAHSLVAEFLADLADKQPTEGALPSGYKLARNLMPASSSTAGVSALPQPTQLEAAAPKDTKVAGPGLMKLAVLMLGYGRPHAVKWAQQLLGVKPVDSVAVTYLGDLPDWAREKSEAKFAWEPEGQLCSRVGKLLQDLGRYTHAEPWLREALAIRQTVLGPEHPDTATSLNGLALLLKAQGKVAEAEPMYRQALAIYQKVLGPKHLGTARSLNNLAVLLRARGKLAEAEPMCREALTIRQNVLGPEHPDTATSLHNLAVLLTAQGKLAEAETMHRQALTILQKVMGPEHPDTAVGLNNLALLLQHQGIQIQHLYIQY